MKVVMGHAEARYRQEGEPSHLGAASRRAAMAYLAKEFIWLWTMTLARPMTEFCTPGGHTVAHDAPEHIAVEADLAQAYGIDVALFRQVDQAENAAHRLGYGRGHGRGPDPPVEHGVKMQVQRTFVSEEKMR